MKILKWAGIVALLSLPVILIVKRKRVRGNVSVEEGNIFAEELSE